ncbi:ArfGAP with SH3 domain, ANK repeat and PH domain-containing protein [Clonorchis sinensis]|uniref:ArfGAP with SH3 domain, ANK repeat and PH domain-containing protein n=1 Tax=Clonorchis sinensis TaxID=79923 RepID=A0A419PTT9_CLOSI|nr:ArfGAP with SH3 domain, ANK repeat and PH domain-containing protein [Clonorchis sinensis]
MSCPLTVDQFISDTLQDIRRPLESDFISKVSSVRCTVYQLDEGIENDRNVLLKAKKLLKAVISSGTNHADSIITLCDYLEKLGQVALESDEIHGTEIAASLCKFSVVHRDLANMSKHLMQNMNSILIFPMEAFMQGDVKADWKKPFERALKEYEYKYDKLRKEKVQIMKDTGIFTPEVFTTEMTEDLEKERRKLQLETCEYLIKVNELKAKRSADLLQHLIDYYYAQSHYLRECLGVMDHFGKSMNDLTNRVSLLQKVHDAQKRRLIDTREEVRILLEKDTSQAGVTYAAQPTQVNRAYGTKKSGFLLKKSDGKVKRVWQRRRVRIGDGELCLYHADESKPPVRLTLLTCQVKLPMDAAPQQSVDGSDTTAGGSGVTHSGSELRNHFDLVSNSRTYNFQAEDDQEFEEWISVLNNAMQEEFRRAMNVNDMESAEPDAVAVFGSRNNNAAAEFDPSQTSSPPTTRYPFGMTNRTGSVGAASLRDSLPGSEHDPLDSSSPTSRSRDSRLSRLGSADALATDVMQSSTYGSYETPLKGKALHSTIQSVLRNCPGNEICADCDRPDPEWVSVNLGVLICLECCGAHRELGVHHSRTQSLLMDDLSTNQLLLPRFVGNRVFNEIFESSLGTGVKPKPLENVTDSSGMMQRRAFVKEKYVDRRYITSTTTSFTTPSSDSPTKDGVGDPRLPRRDPVSERFLRKDLLRAVKTGDLSTLLQVYAEKFDLMTSLLPEDDDDNSFGNLEGMSALHVAVERARFLSNSCELTGASHLPLIEFILQNSSLTQLQRTNSRGDTALHHAIRCGSLDAVKLLLQAGGLPTPLLRITNKDRQTPLQLGEDLLQRDSPDQFTESIAGCVELVRLADKVINTNANSDQPDKLFSGSEGTERSSVLRTTLQDAVDQLSSVDWCLSDLRRTVSKSRLGRSGGSELISTKPVTSSKSSTSKLFTSNDASPGKIDTSRSPGFKVIYNHVASSGVTKLGGLDKDGSSPGRCSQFNSSYGNALATLPRKKGPAPRPPSVDDGPLEFEAYYEGTSTPYSSSTTARNVARPGRHKNSPHKTSFLDRLQSSHIVTTHRTDQSVSLSSKRLAQTATDTPDSSERNGQHPSSDLARLAELMHSSLCAETTAVQSRSATSHPSSRPTGVNQSPRAVGKYNNGSHDHIDIILDVLEEKPDSPVKQYASSVSPAPPIPPKPNIPSSLFQSTALMRSPVKSEICPTTDSVDSPSGEILPTTLPKQNKSVLPTTLRLSQSGLYPDKPLGSSSISHPPSRSTDSTDRSPVNPKDFPVTDTKLGALLEAIYDCDAEHADELTFRRGEVIQLVARSDDEWWEGVIFNQPWRRGLFPITYVRCLPQPGEARNG